MRNLPPANRRTMQKWRREKVKAWWGAGLEASNLLIIGGDHWFCHTNYKVQVQPIDKPGRESKSLPRKSSQDSPPNQYPWKSPEPSSTPVPSSQSWASSPNFDSASLSLGCRKFSARARCSGSGIFRFRLRLGSARSLGSPIHALPSPNTPPPCNF